MLPSKTSKDPEILEKWSKLLASDNFYNMCTENFENIELHQNTSHFESPYEAYIHFMNIVSDLENTRKL